VQENDADQPRQEEREREGDQKEPEGEPRFAAQHPPSTSVASVNSRIARITSTICSAP
jgi:hypothetical protein